MRVLVTGAGGFIGSAVARKLVTDGHEVTAVLSPVSGLERLTDIVDALKIVRADLVSADLTRLTTDVKPDACIHLAWYVDPDRYLTATGENLMSLAAGIRLVSALETTGCPRLVLAGTCLEGNRPAPHPGETIYAASKSALHRVAMCLERMSVVCGHIFSLYGRAEKPTRVVPRVIQACLERRPIDVTSGEQTRDFLHVDDVAAGLAALAMSDIRGGVDVCSGRNTPLRDVFAAIEAAAGASGVIRLGGRSRPPGEPSVIAGDVSTLTGLGWRANWTLSDGIADTVEWWRTRPRSERDSR